MAPWPERGAPSRLASPVPPPMPPPPQLPPPPPPQSQHLSTPRHVRAGSAAERYRSTSRVSEVDVWDTMQNHQIQVDSSSSDEGLHPRSRPRPRHTRSVSHPFPSLFSSKKKRSSPKVAADDESTSESAGERPSLGAKPSSPMRGHRNGSSAGSRDFATGRCMTCGSLLRWPRDLLVFKCTICVTINDLQPVDRLDRPGNAPDAAGVAEERATSKDKAISLTYTKSLAERCLRSFLVSVLKRPTSDGLPIEKAPPVAYSHRPRIQTSPSAPSATTPLRLRPRISPTSEPWLAPGGHRGAAQHRRAPSWAGSTTTTPHFAASPERQPRHLDVSPHPLGRPPDYPPSLSPQVEPKQIFRPLEDYIVACFTSFHCLNSSFLTPRGHPPARLGAETRPRRPSGPGEPRREPQPASYLVPDLDPKLLLLGDVAENGSWWAGWEEAAPAKTASNRSQNGPSTVSSRSPHIDWAALEEWYSTAIEAGRPWSDMYDSLIAEDPGLAVSPSVLQDIEAQILIGQEHVQKALLKACETILKRPGRRITEPQELRFLLLIAANPLLHASYKPYAGRFPRPHSALPTPNGVSPQSSGPASGRHSAIIKRIIGLLSNAPPECHNHLVAWFARYPESRFVQTKDLVAGFLAYRLLRQNEKKYEARIDYMAGLVPSMADGQSSASLHAALGHTQRSSKKQQQEKKPVVYQEDWQIKAAAQVLGFLFAANNMGHARRGLTNRPNAAGNKDRDFVRAPGQILATSDFYMTLLDESDLVADFETWERGQGRFSFCQHPFLLSIGAKIRILEHDARRQMEHKARDAFFDSIMTNRAVQQFLVLNIRRECLVEDSLKAVSEVIGSGGEEIKKGLKINFQGEEGVDAGGLRKEWFLLLVREVFNPDHGTFLSPPLPLGHRCRTSGC
ncbi:uncharacterized protein THITE_2123607 [Thermothielavioides terrestris NRRL 8126]|uniref:HECT-type E3 ubiquitin transferase n=1 Tax=Thermothielavioides terrestris (strain ATCC 38088 / NRRL 8126) TaxID=578455 RepID=G2RHP6_THETT|nr:uncharacterized protein THITE_2123607 [Thermothielavioides terrestris NRRL 8126]AEO71358.1 hypothetical protein THITE_2123607 [Thermothielavioides terrestris NRRL 8126]